MPVDFTAIDFETANGFRGSACSVGVSKVRGGKIVAESSWLMRPPAGHDHFDPRNVAIHGISPGQVASSPRFGEIFPDLAAFIGQDLLVAHNAAFDMGVIRSALEVSELPGPAWDYACTVIMARRSYNLVSYSLPFVAEAAGVPLRNHHDAVEDARACAGIFIDIARSHGAECTEDVFSAMALAPSRMEAYLPGSGQQLSKATRSALDRGAQQDAGASARGHWPEEGGNPPADTTADANHPLYGQTVVFTGNLGMSRPAAKNQAAACGAQPASSVTAKTTVLVVGDGFVAADLSSGKLTAKAKRVLALHARGQRIEVLSEGEFLQMVGGAWPARSS